MGNNSSNERTSVNAGRSRAVSHRTSGNEGKKRGKKGGIAILCIFIVVFIALLVNFVIMPLTGSIQRTVHEDEYYGDNVLIREDATFDPTVVIDNFGGSVVPEHTLVAYRYMMESGMHVDTIKLDLHITADDKLVVLHDHDVDRISDAPTVFHETAVTVGEKTLKELKTLNLGYNFVDKDGNYPYRPEEIIVDDEDEGEGEVIDLSEVRILELGELLDYLEKEARPDGTLNYYIELKDKGESGKKSADVLFKTMEKYGVTDRAVIGSLNSGVTKYIDENYGDSVTRFASNMEITRFYFAFLWKADPGTINYSLFMIPTGMENFYDLTTQAFIDYAHYYDIAVQFKDIIDADEYAGLVENGADSIITCDPAAISVSAQD